MRSPRESVRDIGRCTQKQQIRTRTVVLSIVKEREFLDQWE